MEISLRCSDSMFRFIVAAMHHPIRYTIRFDPIRSKIEEISAFSTAICLCCLKISNAEKIFTMCQTIKRYLDTSDDLFWELPLTQFGPKCVCINSTSKCAVKLDYPQEQTEWINDCPSLGCCVALLEMIGSPIWPIIGSIMEEIAFSIHSAIQLDHLQR